MSQESVSPTSRPPVRFFPPLTDSNYGSQLKALGKKLEERGTLSIQPNKNGVYAASASQPDASPTGYQDAWLRDNAMIAFSRWQCGDSESALKTLSGLTTFLKSQAHKMVAIIDRPELSQDVQKRPHVRFNAGNLKELRGDWAHAQNDTLAYVAWLRFRLAVSNPEFQLSENERDLYNLFPAYFGAIRYWEDLDSGAWEETRKVNCSSVGAVVAALLEFQKLKDDRKRRSRAEATDLQTLIDHGLRTLQKQLPFEAPPTRRTDAALLFLVYPLKLVSPSGPINDPQTQNWILSLVRARLVGSIGTRRYIGDSYYCQDYDKWLPAEMRAGDFSNRVELRDELLQPGCEAQWCLFDPLLSVIYGEKSQLTEQIEFLNRAVAQITDGGVCPELYYLRDGRFVPNEHTPLAWTQANLAIAIHALGRSKGESTAVGKRAKHKKR
jgi:GH15 family glucan-1,4-alpha-glucosidase